MCSPRFRLHPTRFREALGSVRAAGRVVWRSGLLSDLRPAAARVLLRSLRYRRTGPAAAYRFYALAHPEREAWVFEGRRATYGELDTRIDALATGLWHRHGLRRGDAVAIALGNRPEFLEVQAGLGRLGCRAVSVSWRSTTRELAHVLRHSEVRLVFAEAEAAPQVLSAAQGIPPANLVVVGRPHPRMTDYDGVFDFDRPLPCEHADATMVAYTSGTTGTPKGAVRHFPTEAIPPVLHLLAETPLAANERHLVVCPLYHSTAFAFTALTTVLGGCAVLMPHFDPETFLALVQRERITSTAVVPTMLHRVLELPDAVLERYETHSLRAVFCGGAPLPGRLARRFMQRFGQVLYNFYGSTETGINTLATPEDLLEAPGTIGRVLPGNHVRVLGEDGHELGPGQTGELWVHSPLLISGYHRDPEATAASMHEGFFSVGDVGHRDAQGRLYIDGRKRELIISGGVNVYPAEVEEVLRDHPDVLDAAVVGAEDAEWGERVCAFIAPRPGASPTEEAIVQWAREQLAGPKVPRDVRFVTELPRNPTGKVLKGELRQML